MARPCGSLARLQGRKDLMHFLKERPISLSRPEIWCMIENHVRSLDVFGMDATPNAEALLWTQEGERSKEAGKRHGLPSSNFPIA